MEVLLLPVLLAIIVETDGGVPVSQQEPVEIAPAVPVQVEQYLAQTPVVPGGVPADLPPAPPPDEPELLPTLPPLDELLQPPTVPEPSPPGFDVPGTIVVQAFQVVGNTIFSAAELATATEPFTDRPITFAELLAARSAITQLYIDAGYITTGAFIPTDQVIEEGVVEIRIIEGFLEAVVIEGLKDLAPGYVSSRIERAAGRPVNVDDLVEGLQLLQLDPVIETISTELATGTQVGGSIVNVQVEEAKDLTIQLGIDNGRSPTVGSIRGQASLRENNLFGIGDALALAFSSSEGSETVDIGYTVPVSPANTMVGIDFSLTRSDVIDDDFEILSIESESDDLRLFVRHPIIETPAQDLALSLELSYSRLGSTLELPGVERLGLPFAGAPDEEAEVTAIRFSQEWTRRSARRVLAARSRFSLGTDLLGGTDNEGAIPDSNFLSWQGQFQAVQVLAPDTLFVARIDGQLADQPLLSLEQFRLGGLGNVRGFREDEIIADNGIFAAFEVRVPVLRIPEWDSLIQFAPFVDLGFASNSEDSPDPDPRALASVGLGLAWQASDRFTMRLDYGVPLINGEDAGGTLQENGILFSLIGRLF